MRQRGYTMLEIIVALTLLTLGSTMLWYTVRASARADKLNRVHQTALAAAESELEGLRGVPKPDIHDTAYAVAGPGGERLRLVRTVFDSARMVETLPEITLDESLSPAEMRKPLEVRVRVYRMAPEDSSLGGFLSLSETRPDDTAAPMISLTAKLPEYLWF